MTGVVPSIGGNMKILYVGLALAVITLSGCDAFYKFIGTTTESEDSELAVKISTKEDYCRKASVEDYFKYCKETRHQDDRDRDQSKAR